MNVVGKIVRSFYLRNFALLCILLSPTIIQAVIATNRPTGQLLYHLSATVLLYIAFLFHNLFLYERLLLKKKYILYVLGVGGLVYMMNKLFIVFSVIFQKYIPDHTLIVWLSFLWIDVVYIYAGLAVYMAFRYYRVNESVKDLELLSRDVELKQLKEQLQPHFLFNALNNIYSYSLQCDKRSDELILKLSEQMRYIISHSAMDRISIDEEIVFIENYIGFERERLGQRCTIVFDKQIEDHEVKIAPLLFFPFIENAFKHGTSSIGSCAITMLLKVSALEIDFTIENNIFKNTVPVSTGVGIGNAVRRLDLLYPGEHNLQIKNDKGSYKIEIKLNVGESNQLCYRR